MHLVVGLGNPGERYARTRHNVAWAVLDELAARHAAGEGPGHATYRARRAEIAGRAVELLQPLTFMNLSGAALSAWREGCGVEDGLLVVSDDVYLPLGRLRLRAHGSSGGHRGLESIEAAVGSRDYARLRIGVGAPIGTMGEAEPSAALREHVLQEIAPEEAPVLEAAVRRAADAVECWVAEGALGAMNQFNRRPDLGRSSEGTGVEGVREEESET
ncbi:MAG TPA: aminoacyl-tRNA hydrolase [Candidatus Eisenbacteria bacterium]